MNSWVCVDASLALKWIIPGQQDPLVNSLLERWNQAEKQLIAPPLFNAEVTSTIRLNVYTKKLTSQQGEVTFQFFRDLNVQIISPAGLTLMAWEFARTYNQPRTYDMQYLALAELQDCELWTADEKLINSLQGRNNRVHWLREQLGETGL